MQHIADGVVRPAVARGIGIAAFIQKVGDFLDAQPFLMPLPLHPYELSTWKIATVAPNYHISLDKMNYSVPFEYIKKKVDYPKKQYADKNDQEGTVRRPIGVH